MDGMKGACSKLYGGLPKCSSLLGAARTCFRLLHAYFSIFTRDHTVRTTQPGRSVSLTDCNAFALPGSTSSCASWSHYGHTTGSIRARVRPRPLFFFCLASTFVSPGPVFVWLFLPLFFNPGGLAHGRHRAELGGIGLFWSTALFDHKPQGLWARIGRASGECRASVGRASGERRASAGRASGECYILETGPNRL